MKHNLYLLHRKPLELNMSTKYHQLKYITPHIYYGSGCSNYLRIAISSTCNKNTRPMNAHRVNHPMLISQDVS